MHGEANIESEITKGEEMLSMYEQAPRRRPALICVRKEDIGLSGSASLGDLKPCIRA